MAAPLIWIIELVYNNSSPSSIVGVYDNESRASIALEIVKSAVLSQHLPAEVRIKGYTLNKITIPEIKN